jgi:hypothetical protein
MDQDQLKEVIKKGESETVEFKENFDRDSASSFGRIFIRKNILRDKNLVNDRSKRCYT